MNNNDAFSCRVNEKLTKPTTFFCSGFFVFVLFERAQKMSPINYSCKLLICSIFFLGLNEKKNNNPLLVPHIANDRCILLSCILYIHQPPFNAARYIEFIVSTYFFCSLFFSDLLSEIKMNFWTVFLKKCDCRVLYSTCIYF